MLLPRQAHHDADLMLSRQIQQPAGWNRVRTDGIQPIGGNLAEVGFGNGRVGVGITVRARTEGPVGHTPDPKLFPGVRQELARRRGPVKARALHYSPHH